MAGRQGRLAGLSAGGTLTVAHDSNHMAQSDEPNLVIDAILSVITKVAGGAKAGFAAHNIEPSAKQIAEFVK
jgi:hypothetical protein